MGFTVACEDTIHIGMLPEQALPLDKMFVVKGCRFLRYLVDHLRFAYTLVIVPENLALQRWYVHVIV